jgi:hypothetical protein
VSADLRIYASASLNAWTYGNKVTTRPLSMTQNAKHSPVNLLLVHPRKIPSLVPSMLASYPAVSVPQFAPSLTDPVVVLGNPTTSVPNLVVRFGKSCKKNILPSGTPSFLMTPMEPLNHTLMNPLRYPFASPLKMLN